MLFMIAKFDPETTEKLRLLRQIAEQHDCQPASPFYGHLTIAAFVPEDYTDFLREGIRLAKETGPFEVSVKKIEVLDDTSVIVAEAEKTGGLLQLHDSVATLFRESMNYWTARPEWYPHSTLLYAPDTDLEPIADLIRPAFVPFKTLIDRIEFSKQEETGFTIIESIKLTDSVP